MIPIDEELLRKALDTYGDAAQEFMILEECGELIAALSKVMNGRASSSILIPEIADVLIVAHQARIIFGVDDVDSAIKLKQKILRERLADNKVKIPAEQLSINEKQASYVTENHGERHE